MEFFNKAKAVKLRGHLDKYLVADDDQETVRQSRNGASRRATWIVELVEENSQFVRLKSCHGRYLTASDVPFLLGMTGKRVLQTVPDAKSGHSSVEWEPVRDAFQARLRTRAGKYLRANGGPPPWRNSITHDSPQAGGTKSWVLWDVVAVEIPEADSFLDYLTSMSSFSSVADELLSTLGSEPASPVSQSPRFSSKQTAMDLFRNAKAVRLRCHHEKYLFAEEDEESVTQDRNGSSKNAKWTVEFVSDSSADIIRLKSCYNKYLTASNHPFLLGMTGRKVIQTQPRRLDSSLEWEPVKDGTKIRLKTRYGNFLRANGGLPPWRNSVTHDVPHRTATQDWILWDVDIVEIQVQKPPVQPVSNSDSFASESSSPSSVSVKSAPFSRQESTDSSASSPPKVDGRTIYYHFAEDDGDVDDGMVGYSLTFKGNGVEELTRKLEEETGLENIIVCSRSPLNGKLYPLRLQLPPNNTTMHVVVVPSSSNMARDFAKSGIPL